MISDIRQITRINHLQPHISTQRKSPSPTSGSFDVGDSSKSQLGPLLNPKRSNARNVGKSATLMPIMQSIGAQISPLRSPRETGEGATFLTDLSPVAPSASRYKTPRPIARNTIDEALVTNSTGIKYLQSGKMEKETVQSYIGTSRVMLRKNLTNEARKRDLSNVSAKYESEVSKFKSAKQNFDEDFQRFVTMKADMEAIGQVSQEHLTAKLNQVQELEK